MPIIILLFIALTFLSCKGPAGIGGNTDSTTQGTVLGPGITARPENPDCHHFPSSNDNGILEHVQVFQNMTLNKPVAMHQVPGDESQLYILELGGKILKVDNDPNAANYSTYLDLSGRFTYSFGLGEHGTVDFAFHPNFEITRKVYLFYRERTADVACGPEFPFLCPTRVVLSEFQALPDNSGLDPDSEKFLIAFLSYTPIHHGGSLVFDPNGMLLISIGDGSEHHAAQNTFSIAGSVLRIDVDGPFPYGIPGDNPFLGGGGLPEIYAYGLRNPFRMSLDAATGDIWLGDVGDGMWEEVNKVSVGGNYGWPYYEGSACYFGPCDESQNIIAPEFSYPHQDGCSITGGFVYRGSLIPALYGHYLFGDFCSGNIWAMNVDSPDPAPATIVSTGGGNIVSFAQDLENELYFLDYQGKIHKITGYQPPQPGTAPLRLSQTGCFDPADPQRTGEGLIPYSVNMPLWSDGAEKDRWMALPDGAQIEIQEDGRWKFPVGTVLVKSFSLQDRLIETRLFMQHASDEWSGYTYEWNDEQTEAFLVPSSGKTKFVAGQNWFFPSRTQCLRCHNAAAGHVLGPETPQMNRLFKYPATGIESNQLLTLAHIGMFSNLSAEGFHAASHPQFPLWENALPPPEKLNETARAYLHANCAICHRPGGPGFGPEDFRYFVPLQDIGACDANPTIGDLGLNDPRLIKPGVPEESVVWARMNTTGPSRMPPLATFHVDTAGTETIAEWIRSLDSCEAE